MDEVGEAMAAAMRMLSWIIVSVEVMNAITASKSLNEDSIEAEELRFPIADNHHRASSITFACRIFGILVEVKTQVSE